MKITTVTIGKSVQVFQIGQPEYWHKVTMEAIVEENDTITDVVDKLFYEVDLAHEKHSQSVVPSQVSPKGDLYFNVSTQKEER